MNSFYTLNSLNSKGAIREGVKKSYFEFVSSKSYVLDRSESIDMHIEVVLKKPNLLVSAKKQFFPYGRGGGFRKLWTCLQLLGFFLRLP